MVVCPSVPPKCRNLKVLDRSGLNFISTLCVFVPAQRLLIVATSVRLLVYTHEKHEKMKQIILIEISIEEFYDKLSSRLIFRTDQTNLPTTLQKSISIFVRLFQ